MSESKGFPINPEAMEVVRRSAETMARALSRAERDGPWRVVSPSQVPEALLDRNEARNARMARRRVLRPARVTHDRRR